MRRDRAPHRRGRGGRRAVRRDRDSGALARALSAAGGGRSAPRRNSGALHARHAASRRRRAQLPRAAALRARSASPPRVSPSIFARPDAGGRGAAHARGLGAAAGGRRGDRRAGALGDAARMACARSCTAAMRGGGRSRSASALRGASTASRRWRDFALPVIGKLAALPERATWGEWIAALSDLAESTLREPERVVELLEELEPMSAIGPVELGAGAAGARSAAELACGGAEGIALRQGVGGRNRGGARAWRSATSSCRA